MRRGRDRATIAHLVPCRQFQVHILSYGRCPPIGTGLVPLLVTKLGPRLSLSNSMLDERLLEGALDTLCDLQAGETRSLYFSQGDGRFLTLTFFPSSLTEYSTMVRMPSSSTKSCVFGCSAEQR